MEDRYLTTQEVADLLQIKKTTVYDLLKKGDLPGVKVGKQFRVREADVRAILRGQSVTREKETPESGEERFVLCGQDGLLDLLAEHANRLLEAPVVCRSHLGSYNGLVAMYRRQADAATAHLWDRETDSYNLPFITRLLPNESVQVYHLVRRPVGIYVQSGNPKNITAIEDFARADVAMISRERGSGIRVLTDGLLMQAGLNTAKIKGYSQEAGSHLEAAAAVASGRADCAIGNQKAAKQTENVEFVPLRWENYDLIIRTEDLARSAGRAVIAAIQTPQFREALDGMGGYDTRDMGKRIL